MPTGQAAEDGRLQEGDEIFAVNGNLLQGLSHSEAIAIFKQIRSGPVVLQTGRRTQQQQQQIMQQQQPHYHNHSHLKQQQTLQQQHHHYQNLPAKSGHHSSTIQMQNPNSKSRSCADLLGTAEIIEE